MKNIVKYIYRKNKIYSNKRIFENLIKNILER